MPQPTDKILARYVAEIQDRQAFIDSLIESSDNDDLSDEKVELITEARNRIQRVNELMQPLEESRRISHESNERIASMARFMVDEPKTPTDVEYRSVGEYILDYCDARNGDGEKRQKIDIYNRTAAHNTTSNASGLIPTPILGPVINFIDSARPLVTALGVRQVPSGTFYRPKVTVHTAVAAQGAEKTELTSTAMTIGKLTVTPVTYGGYVNVSRQLIDWSQPQAMDIIVGDLAAEYAITTEAVAATAIYGTATATTGGTIDASPTADEVASVIWSAAGQVYTATKGLGRILVVCSPDVLGSIGPLFAPINPTNAQGSGFQASDFGQGVMGAISGIQVVVTTGFGATKRLVVMSSAAAEVYEDRIGALQVIEPSVLGVQVAYAGSFAELTVEAAGIIKIGVA